MHLNHWQQSWPSPQFGVGIKGLPAGRGARAGSKVGIITLSRLPHTPLKLLDRYRGIVQCDGYAAYKTIANAASDEAITLAFCWAHL